ncbi:MAG: TRAP transporter TatT component family protein [Brevinematales bacterium]|nr:TRAP transporter TatT component family protein [Brevinematales bacterium]
MRIFVIIWILVLFSSLYASADLFKDIKSESDAKKAYEHYKDLFTKNKNNYEIAWKFCAYARFYGFYFLKDKKEREMVFEEAKDAGEIAVKLNPESIEANYFLGVAYGSYAQEKGVMNSLFLAGPIVDLMTKVIKKNPSYRDGSAYMVRANVYSKAPGWPMSIGDVNKAISDFENAIKYENKSAYRNYAEFLINRGDKSKARQIIEKALSLPLGNELVIEEYEMKMLKNLLEKIK